jgi:predicted tellurium resistance membrane protein TerC
MSLLGLVSGVITITSLLDTLSFFPMLALSFVLFVGGSLVGGRRSHMGHY